MDFMDYRTLISTDELADHLADPRWAIIDCRFQLADPQYGQREYLKAHIPGAVYCHLDNDLCGPVEKGKTGRHPLPDPERLARNFARWGIDSGVQVVVYDDWEAASGGIAARLWWSLRWLGHEAVAVLDGGWRQWRLEGRPVRGGEETRRASKFMPCRRDEWLAHSDDIERMRQNDAFRVIDSRAAERYRGEQEPIDPVAGHIPGALSAPYFENIGPGGLMLSPEELRKRFENLLGDVPARDVAFYCGSGVTAALNLLALAHAGMGAARLYVGSWSEWITDPSRPVSR